MVRTGLVAALAMVVAVPAAAQQSGEFHWSGALSAGQVIEIKGVNGDIHATAATGSQVEVLATKSSHRSDPASVQIQVVHGDDGVTICAVYPTPRDSREENRCAPGSEGHMNTRDNDVRVDFTVRVPAGVRFTGRTVNGDVEAQGMRADVKARTVNGGVQVSTSGQADASTVNGSIELSMGRADWSGDLALKTVNGSITVELPAGLNTELDARTVNGSIQSDFPLTVTGRISPRHLTATIGSGGRHLELTTVNGDIRIRKAG
jgi:DUF4097 and DUF4098 domain-containing protein YvlB